MRDIQIRKRNSIRLIIRRIVAKPFVTVINIIFILVILNLIYPTRKIIFTSMKEGDIAQKDIIAPFTFPIQKSPEELSRERKKAIESILPVVEYDKEKTEEINKGIEKLFAILYGRNRRSINDKIKLLNKNGFLLSRSTVVQMLKPDIKKQQEKIKNIIKKPLLKGIIYDKDQIPFMKEKRVTVRKNGTETIYGEKDFYNLTEAKKYVENRIFSTMKGDEQFIKAVDEVVGILYSPNLRVNIEETERRRKEAGNSVPLTKGLVLKGEMIVRAHDQVTRDKAAKLESLNLILSHRKSPKDTILLRSGINILFLVLLFIIYFYIVSYERVLWKEREKLLIVELTTLVFLYLITFLFKLEHTYLFLIPAAFLSMLFAMLFGEIVSMLFSFVIASIIAIFFGMRFPIFIYVFGGSIAGIFGIRGIKKRTELYKGILTISVTNILLILSIELFSRARFGDILLGSSFGFANGIVSVFLLSVLIPFFEKLAGKTTNITLFELSDLNLPLLKKLSVVAPGTYNHSIVVANLAEAAAEAIGANSILTRVASYYHDIGKMSKPEYFIENQMGMKNPHSKLTPRMSCIILIAHVKEGVIIAQKAGLPVEIVNIIREHHGTSLIVPFFEKAKKQNQSEKIEEEQFRYPGPLPSSKESGIVMLADAIEAASRSIEEPNAKKLKTLIKDIIKNRFQEGQLDESHLTLVDLKKIGDSFLPILVGMHHLRVEYPS